MALDIHKVRTISQTSARTVADAKRNVEAIVANYRGLGSSFTSDRLYAREYSDLDSRAREASKALDRLQEAVRNIERKG